MLLIRSSLTTKLNLTRLNHLMGFNVHRASSHFQSEAMKQYWEKNEQLKRPVSPYVMYKPQITTVLSITHRMTGIGLSVPLYALGISQLMVNTNWSNQLVELQSICPNTFLAVKLLIVSSFYYHLFNGVRHLSWDLGKGYQLKQLYASGYTVIVLSLIATIITMYNL